jgi:hypothetical protein
MVTLPLEYLNGWLFKVNAGRYKPNDPRREVIIRYQRECFLALYSYWHQGAALNPRAAGNGPEDPARLLAEVRELAARLARVEDRVDGARAAGSPSGAPSGTLLFLPSADLDAERLRGLLAAWRGEFGRLGATVADAIRQAEEAPAGAMMNALERIAAESGGIVRARSLGRWIGLRAGRVVDGAAFVRAAFRHKVICWAVVPVSLQGTDLRIVSPSHEAGRC